MNIYFRGKLLHQIERLKKLMLQQDLLSSGASIILNLIWIALTWWIKYVIWCLRLCCPVGICPFFCRNLKSPQFNLEIVYSELSERRNWRIFHITLLYDWRFCFSSVMFLVSHCWVPLSWSSPLISKNFTSSFPRFRFPWSLMNLGRNFSSV